MIFKEKKMMGKKYKTYNEAKQAKENAYYQKNKEIELEAIMSFEEYQSFIRRIEEAENTFKIKTAEIERQAELKIQKKENQTKGKIDKIQEDNTKKDKRITQLLRTVNKLTKTKTDKGWQEFKSELYNIGEKWQLLVHYMVPAPNDPSLPAEAYREILKKNKIEYLNKLYFDTKNGWVAVLRTKWNEPDDYKERNVENDR